MKRFQRGILIALMLVLTASIVLGAGVTYLSLREPQSVTVQKGDTVNFDFEGQTYDISITNFYTYSVEFQITGKLNYFVLHEGESIEVNLDDFGDNDIKITASSLIDRLRGQLLVEKIAPVSVREAPMFKPVERVLEPAAENITVPVVAPAEPEAPPIDIEEIGEAPVQENPALDYAGWLYMGLALIVLAAILMLVMYLKVASYAVAGVPPKLIKYVKNAVALETSPEDIRSEMKEAGWNDEEIDLAFKNVMGKLETSAA